MRICLPVQRTQVHWLIQEDSTFCGATKPVCHKLLSLHVLCNEKPLTQPEKAHHSHEDLTATRESLCTAMKTSPQPKKAHYSQEDLTATRGSPSQPRRPHHNQRKTVHSHEDLTATRESPCTATKTQCSQNYKINF